MIIYKGAIQFSEEDINSIISLYVDDKKSIKCVSDIQGCSITPIVRVLKDNDIIIRRRGWNFKGVPKTYAPWNKGTKGIMQDPWNKGLTKHTSKRMMAVSKKNSENQKGKTPWNKGIVGDNNTSIRKIIRDRQKFKDWRIAVYKRDKNICQLCGHKNTNKMPINAHHIYNLNDIINDYNITTLEEAYACDVLWNINNGISLCIDCHKRVHRGEVVPE